MPRRARVSTGGLDYRVLNRRVVDWRYLKIRPTMLLAKILQEAHGRTRIRTGSVLSDGHRLSAQPGLPFGTDRWVVVWRNGRGESQRCIHLVGRKEREKTPARS